jgi:hypothetical protein
MASHLEGIGGAFKSALTPGTSNSLNHSEVNNEKPQQEKKDLVLANRAVESRSPYVRAHAGNPVAWQIWGNETIALAKKENKLLFVSVGYSACHCKSCPCRIAGYHL